MLTQIYNGHILTPEGWVNGGSVFMDNGRIVEITNNSNIEPKAELTINAKGMHVVPGGIELHCHGGGGRAHEARHHSHVPNPFIIYPEDD